MADIVVCKIVSIVPLGYKNAGTYYETFSDQCSVRYKFILRDLALDRFRLSNIIIGNISVNFANG